MISSRGGGGHGRKPAGNLKPTCTSAQKGKPVVKAAQKAKPVVKVTNKVPPKVVVKQIAKSSGKPVAVSLKKR